MQAIANWFPIICCKDSGQGHMRAPETVQTRRPQEIILTVHSLFRAVFEPALPVHE